MIPESDIRSAVARGWVLHPLHGKKAYINDWQQMKSTDADLAVRWARAGNIGICAGQSGLLILDCDPRNGGQPYDLDLPDTVTVETGGGGWHFYFLLPSNPPTNRNNFIKGWDCKSIGGYVVFPGSVHPDTGELYAWMKGRSPEDIAVAEIPADVLALTKRATPSQAAKPPTLADRPSSAGTGYARAALEREFRDVATAPEGSRNATLNRAAFSLGQLVGSGLLDRDHVVSELMVAAATCGLHDREASATIASGLRSGASQPRQPKPRMALQEGPRSTVKSRSDRQTEPVSSCEAPCSTSGEAVNASESPIQAFRTSVLIPGSHTLEDGTYVEQSAEQFAAHVIAALPLGAIYRRADIPGRVVGPIGARRFSVLTVAECRLLVDEHVRLTIWKTSKKEPDLQVDCYVSCSSDLASLVLAAASTDPAVPSIDLMVSYPVVTKHGISPPGFAHGIYYDEPTELAGIVPDPTNAIAILTDLVIDFPFADDASRQNFFGLLLTPILRPITRNAPLHLVMASLPRTGKTKLVDEVLGGVILGRPTPAIQLSGSDEERDKRILAALLRGDTIRHLDNLREYLDSAVLASLLTAPVYSGRILSRSELVDLPNHLTLVGTGNNVRATKEIVERSVPIVLQPSAADPSSRSDFAHADLPAYVSRQRRNVFAALLGMIEAWRAGGSSPGAHRMGGFEDWTRVVGGILKHAGCPAWLGNARGWRRGADPAGADLESLVEEWWRLYGSTGQPAKVLAAAAKEAGLFPDCWAAKTEPGQVVSFSKRVLSPHVDAPVAGGRIIRRIGSGSTSLWKLESGDIPDLSPGVSGDYFGENPAVKSEWDF